MITHNKPVALPESSTQLQHHQIAELRRLRHELHLSYRPILQQGAGPIRVMARMVADLERQCRALDIPEDIIQAEIVNRTIGDVNLRQVTECEGEEGGSGDYRMLAEEIGIALPGENIHGYIAPGTTYLWLRDQMLEFDRQLLAEHFDLRIYDILAIGNPLLRTSLAKEMQQWGFPVTQENVYLGLGAMDSLNKIFCGLMQMYREQGVTDVAALFPTPGFATPEWQANSYGYHMLHLPTLPENHFKLTAPQLQQTIAEHPDIRVIYLSVTNNPTTFAYTPDELNAIHEVLRAYREKGQKIYLLADLAYIGTGKPEEDSARMATFIADDVLKHTIFVSSFSKTMTLTGERFGWVTCGDAALSTAIAPGWSNTVASLPAEWQLRFMAYMRLIESRPWLIEKLRAFYRLRRQRFSAQLRQINEQQPLFEEIYLDDDATVYNWSKLRSGEDAFTLFEKTGIAGVPGSGFGYSDEYIRFSIGVIPVPIVNGPGLTCP